jgi:hypothetical protein
MTQLVYFLLMLYKYGGSHYHLLRLYYCHGSHLFLHLYSELMPQVLLVFGGVEARRSQTIGFVIQLHGQLYVVESATVRVRK